MKRCATSLILLLFTASASASSFLDSATDKDASQLINSVSEKYDADRKSVV